MKSLALYLVVAVAFAVVLYLDLPAQYRTPRAVAMALLIAVLWPALLVLTLLGYAAPEGF